MDDDAEDVTVLLAPDALQRELRRSRGDIEPVAVLTPDQPVELSDVKQIEALMASSIEKSMNQLPTAPAAFPIVKLDAGIDLEVLGPGAPEAAARMVGAPDAPAPASAPLDAEPIGPPRRRSRVALALLLIVAAVVGTVITVYLLAPSPG